MKSLAFYLADGGAQIAVDAALADLVAGATDVPVKFGFRSSGDEAWGATLKARIVPIGSSDGNQQLRIVADTQTLTPPWGLAGAILAAPAASGTWATVDVYAAVVTALNGNGETVASQEATARITDPAQGILWSWQQVPLATGYRLYRRGSTGSYSPAGLVASLAGGGTLSVVDRGAAPGTGYPPIINTTAGAGPSYGTPPAMSALGPGPVAIGALAPGRWAFLWAGRVVAPGDDAGGAMRFGGIKLTES